MANSLLKQFARASWEALPEYGNVANMNEAIAEERGTCLHRSILIGRQATKAGLPAWRQIYFTLFGIPCAYSNLVGVEDQFYAIKTTHTPTELVIFPVEGTYVEGTVYVSLRHAGVSTLPYESPPTDASVLYIPEQSMTLYRGCLTAREYIKQACLLKEEL